MQRAAVDASALGAQLEKLYETGRTRWPELEVPAEAYVLFLTRNLPDLDDVAKLGARRGAELYLVCAYGLGRRGAHDAVEAECMPRVCRALLKLGTTQATIDDISQELRQRLLEMGAASSQHRGYSGRGSLTGWLTVCAVRAAWLRRSEVRKERSLEESTAALLPTIDRDPETALLIERYKDSFERAFAAALARLSSRERNVLRYHFLWRLSIDQLARIYGIHRATAARWITSAQKSLTAQTREAFLARIAASPDSMPQVVALLQSQLSVRLSALLAAAVEAE